MKNFTKLGSKLQANWSQMARNLHVIERRFSSTDRLSGSRSERSLTSEEASIQHPLSIHSASIEHPLGVGGNQVATRSLFRIWKYAAMITLLLTLACGQAWGDTQVTFTANATSGQRGYVNSNDVDTLIRGQVTLKLDSLGSATANKQIYNSSATKEASWVLSTSATSDANKNYIELKASSGYNITGMQIRLASNGSTVSRCIAVCFASAFSMENNSVLDTISIPLLSNANDNSASHTITLSGIPSGTGCIRIYKAVRYDGTNKKLVNSKGTTIWASSSAQTAVIPWIKVTYEAAAAATYKLGGSWNDYSEHTMTVSDGVASYSVDLDADSRYEFYLKDNGTAYKSNGTIMAPGGWVFTTGENNAYIHTGPAGTYTFSMNTSTHAVSVTYPDVTHPSDHYVYFKNSDVWGIVHAYLRDDADNKKAAAWPGSPTATTTICNQTYHYAALNGMNGTYTKIQFNDGYSGYGHETSVLSVSGSAAKYNANRDANWYDPAISITFDKNGGTGTMDKIVGICSGDDKTLPANTTITRTGWEFDGWNTNKYGGGDSYDDGATIEDITANITLYAQWKKTVYMQATGDLAWWNNDKAWFAIYYWDNSASSNNGYVNMELVDCETNVYKATLPGNGYDKLLFLRMNPANKPTPSTTTGKWNQTSNISYPTSNPKFTINGGSDQACTGDWGAYTPPAQYTITFNAGEGSGLMSAIEDICEGTNQDLTANSFTAPTGYEFDAWHANVDVKVSSSTVSKGDDIDDEATLEDLASDVTLTAQWKAKTYTVTLDDEDATTAVSPGSVTATYNSSTIASITNPLKTGYTFGGWYKSEAGENGLIINTSGALQSSTDYTDGSGNWHVDAGKTVYAKWTQSVTIDGNGGSADGSVDVTYKGSAGTPSVPTYAGHTVDLGYYAESSCTNKVMALDGTLQASVIDGSSDDWTNSSSKWVYAGAATLYAHWKCNTPEISCSSNTITISVPTGATVYYTTTTDGSTPADPTSSSTAYDPSSKPTISADTKIKAIAIQSGCTSSDVASEECDYKVPEIALINQSTGAIDNVHFFTGVASTSTDASPKTIKDKSSLSKYISFSSAVTSPGKKPTDSYVQYDVKTTSTTIYVYAYNTNGSGKNFYLQEFKEGKGSGESKKSKSISGNSGDTIVYNATNTTNSTIYITVSSTDVKIYQVVAVESGTSLTQPGDDGYSISFKKGRPALADGSLGRVDGIEIVPSADYTAASTTYMSITTKNTNYIKFTPTDDCYMTVLTANDNAYYISTSKGDVSGTAYTGSRNNIALTGSTTYYINPNGNEVQISQILFRDHERCFEITDARKKGDLVFQADTVVPNSTIEGSIWGGQFKKTGGSASGNKTHGIIFDANNDEYTVTLWGNKVLAEGSVISITQHGNGTTGTETGFKISGNSMSPETYTNTTANEENTQTYTVPAESPLIGSNSFTITRAAANTVYLYSMYITGCDDVTGHTVTYADGGADSGDVPEDDTLYEEGEEVTVLDNTDLEKTGHTFDGWTANVDLTIDDATVTAGTTIAAGAEFEMPASNVTLTAVWTPNVYNITYNLNSGSWVNTGSATYTYGVGYTLPTGADITKTNYTFIGWYDNSSFTGSAITAIAADATGDQEYWAKWGATRTIAWYVDGSTYSEGTPTTTTCEELGITTMPTAPSALSCSDVFRGWSTTNLEGNATDTPPAVLFTNAAGAPSIDGNKTFYAVFANNAAVDATSFKSTFTSKAWAVADSKWTSGKDGSSLVTDRGIQVSTTTTGANAITKLEYKAVTKVVVTYSTNSDAGAGSIEIKVGGTAVSGSADVTKTGGTEDRTINYIPASSLDGKVQITVNCTTNSIYIKSVQIYHSGSFVNYRCVCPSVTVTPKLVTAGTPIFITSAAGKTVRSQDTLHISGSGFASSTTLTLKDLSPKFTLKSATNGAISTDATGSIDTDAFIFYNPGATTEDGLDKNSSFTITDGKADVEVDQPLIGRHLPTNFVIAAKVSDTWYALPADKANGTPDPVEITVDNATTPTSAITSEANVYSLYGQTGTVISGGNGQYVKLAMHGQNNYPLFGSSSTGTNLGKSTGQYPDNDLSVDYWWLFTQTNTSVSTTTDVKYNMTVANNNTKHVRIYSSKWGLYASGVDEMRILTWTCANPAAPTISGTTDYTVGDEIELTASHDGSNHDAMTTYTWYKGADWATASAASPVQAAATGSSGYTLTIASCTTDDAGTYWCEASNGTCSAHNSSGYAITVSEASCTPQTVSKVVVTGSSAGTTSGYNNKEYVGTPVINVSNKETYGANIDGVSGNETGYKMTGNGTSIVFATLSKGTFQEGDVVKIGITKKNDTRAVDEATDILTIYYGTNKDDATALTTISADAADFYEYELTSSDITTIGTKKGIGLFRESSNGENPYVYSVEIIGCRDWMTCTAPTAVAAGSVTGTSATFTITDAENTLNYELYISTSSTTPTADATPTATSSSKTKTVTGLSGSTTYYYWVRSNCGGYKSDWTAGTPATFTTGTAYTVTYNGNGSTGGSVPTDATGYAEGDVVTVKTNSGSLVKSGYTFVGWSTNSTPASGTFYPAGYKFTMGAGNVTLYAVWASGGASAYYYGSVSITAGALTPGSTGGHKGFFTNEGGTVATSSDISLSSTPSETGYYYESSTLTHTELSKSSNWNTSSSSKRTIRAFKFANNTSYTLALGSATATKITFYGKCGSASRILSVGGVEWTSNSTKETFEYHEFTKVGNFTGNITIGSIDASSDNRGDFYGILVVTMADGGSSGYTVTFDKNGQGSYSNSISNVPSGSKIGAPIPAPTATGYEFGGWYREAGCSNEWNFGSNTITKDTTLFAKWTTCAPSISADPSGTSYNQNADATALSVTATGEDLTYQWYSNESNSNSDGTEIPGATSASYTPSTALVGTIYYYCIVTNDCGNATSAVAAITVNDSKPNPTASWTIATPTHGGKGFSFSVTAYKNDGSTAWDGTLTTAMLSASEDVVLSGVTVSDNTISGTYGVKASATSPVTFYLELPSTTNCAAATLEKEQSFTACSGTGVDGSTYEVPFLAKYSSSTSGKPSYYCESEHGYISPELGTSSVSLASEGYDDFDYYINSGRGSVLIFTKVDEVKKIQVYLNANSGPAKVTNVYTAASYSTALKDYTELTEKTDYTVTYTDEDSNTSIAKGKNGHVDIAFTTNIAEGTLVYVVLKEKAKYFGAKLTTGAGSGATIDTELAWSNSQSDGATVVKGEDDAEFTITASRSGAAATASLGEIRYSSSDTKIATVNATTGEVTIADKISFGEDEYKTTTIKATLVSSGCYKSASITYTLQVNKSKCTEAAGTVAITSESDCSVELTVSGYEEGASIAWYKDGSAITPAATGTTYTATTSGTYTAVTTKDCARTSNSIIVTMSATATASKIVDSWYVKNGRRTPDIALVQTTGATSFTVKSGETTIWDEANSNITGFGGCDFELKEDGIIYLHGTKSNGDAPSDLVAGNETITVTVSGCGGALSGLDIIIKKQAETLKPSVAFVVDGTTRAKGGTATSVSTAKTSERPLWTYLSSSFTLTGCNIYWSVDSKELREYYSQYDAIVVTDDPNTQTKGAGDVEYVKAFGTLVDVRPILTMEAYVGRYTDGGWHVYNATPTSPNPRQVEMKLECRNHEIFAGVSESSDNVRTKTINGDDYWYITIVDTTQSPYKGTTKDYKDLPALQGFDPNSFSDMLGIGTIKEDELQAGVERQQEPAARMMILGIQNNAMGALTNEGKLIIKNAISYLLKTNMEEVDDCSNYFIGGTEGHTNDWTVATNWSKNSVPDFTTKVRIMAPVVITKYQKVRAAQVDIVKGGTSSKKDGELNGHVTINPGGALVVGGTVNRAIAPHYGIDDLQPTTDEDIFIKADANNSAALILDNSSGLTGATVQMYSSSHWDGSSGSKVKYWSYVAVPIQEALIPDYFMGAFTYYYVEKDGWKKKWDGDYLYPFQAIGLSRDNPGTEHFWGPLVSTENRDIKLTKTSTGGGGENLIANSWTAPIQIANFDADDFGDANATVYIYNTGDEGAYAGTTIIDANTTNQGAFTAGQWLGIPIGVAKLKEYEGLKVIPAMQSFEVDMPAEADYGAETTLHLDYDRLVRGVDISKDTLTEKLHAPKRRMSKNDGDVEAVMKVRVAGIHTLAEVWLIQDGAFGEGFDNGWEAYYAPCDNRSPQLYAHSEIGNMGITAKPELEGTILGFAPSRDGADYTFSFYYRGDEELYLNDLLTETSTPITNEDTYAFTASENGDGSRFIISSNPYETPQIITGTEVVKEAQNEKVKKFIYNDKLYILYRGMIFDANGKLINRK